MNHSFGFHNVSSLQPQLVTMPAALLTYHLQYFLSNYSRGRRVEKCGDGTAVLSEDFT